MDHRNRVAFPILLGVLALSACSSGGGNGGGGSDPGVQNESPGLTWGDEHGAPVLTVGEIAGVWDQSADVEENGVTAFDEAYVVISESGIYAEYDYLGDDYAKDYQNCYDQMTYGTITANGDGTFAINVVSAGLPLEEDIRYSVVDDKLTAPASLFTPDGVVVSIPRAETGISKDEIESMICDMQF